jgi:carboxypeptidase Taq
VEKKLNQLKTILGEVDDLDRANSVLGWDQQAYMPPGGAEARGNIQATLSRLSHEKATSEEVGKLLEELDGAFEDADSDDARLIKVARRNYQKATKVPSEMVAERAKLQTIGNQAWQQARAKSDFSIFQPHLEKMVDWVQRYGDLFKPYDHIYDPLLDDYEPGMKTAEVQAIFDHVRPQQVELIKAIAEQEQIDDSFLHQHFDEAKQFDFGVEVAKRYGYDFERGRQDKVTHPFMTNLGYGDQRITVRVSDKFFNTYFFAAMHETGHALYEQGIRKDLERSPLYGGTSLAVHESQSRLWENLVGRSRPFWTHFYPRLQEIFPSQLKGVDVGSFYKGINKVAPSFIRVEADEATYNLHIMLRMQIEIEMLNGELDVKDLPDLWNSRFEEYFGIVPENDALGCLQDVHWSFGLYGYFSTYALGNLVSSQLWEKIEQDLPDAYDQISKGKFEALHNWLAEKIYVHGSKFEPQELVQRVTGEKINGDAYIRYLRKKFGEIYGLS